MLLKCCARFCVQKHSLSTCIKRHQNAKRQKMDSAKSDLLAADYPFVLNFERNFDITWGQRTFQKWWVLVMWSSTLLYLAFVYQGRRLMEKRSKFSLRPCLFVWNFTLTIFSSFGAMRTIQELCHVISTKGYFASITDRG